MKTRKMLIMALTLIFTSVLLLGCTLEQTETTANSPTEPFDIVVDPDREDLSNRATAEQITKEMWVGDVYAIMGIPQREPGSGEMYLEWDLKSGETLLIRFDRNHDDQEWYVANVYIN